jgi:hypothetical protein
MWLRPRFRRCVDPLSLGPVQEKENRTADDFARFRVVPEDIAILVLKLALTGNAFLKCYREHISSWVIISRVIVTFFFLSLLVPHCSEFSMACELSPSGKIVSGPFLWKPLAVCLEYSGITPENFSCLFEEGLRINSPSCLHIFPWRTDHCTGGSNRHG